MDFLVGTFNTAIVYTLRFHPPGDLQIVHRSPAVGSHSWLALADDKRHLYATAWLANPSIVSYSILPDHGVKLLNQKQVKSTSGYVAASKSHLYSAGGPTGEAFRINPDGSIGDLIQELDFVDSGSAVASDTSSDSHGGFGGLRHGAHSIDLSPNGRALYVADIGRNCVWTFQVNDRPEAGQHLQSQHKAVAPRSNDGPRHATPHPNGKVLYSVQEHSGMVDVFHLDATGTRLEHAQGVRIMPRHEDENKFWADEVRVSASGDAKPRFMFASTRGLKDETKGYVSVYRLDDDGLVQGEALHMWQTPTSGGIANAVEPAPSKALAALGVDSDVEYIALTDSLEGWVFVLKFDGEKIEEASRVRLGVGEKSATAVWL